MTDVRALLTLELRSFYGINKYRYTKDTKEKNRARLLLVAWAIILVMICTYVGGLVYGLCTLGFADIVPAYLAVLSSALVIAFSMFSAGVRVFGQHGYAMLVSLPIKTSSLVIARFLGLYIADLAVTLVVTVSGMAVYGVCTHPPLWTYLAACITTLFVPAIPLVISVVFGMGVLVISSRMKHKSIMQSLISVAVVVGVMSVSFGMEGKEFSTEQLSSLATVVTAAIGKVYPPALWLNAAVVQGNIVLLALFATVSAAVCVAAMWIVTKVFHTLVRRLYSFTAKHAYTVTAMHRRGLLKTLYVRELKRYFSSGIYVTNTIIGPIMGAIMAVVLCVTGVETVQNALMPLDVKAVAPFVLAAAMCMMTTTSVSVSMEGKHIWVVQSLPIPPKTWLDSKLLVNATLMVPFFAVAVTAFAIALQPTLLQLVWLIAVPVCIMAFSLVFGITVNLKIHAFDWQREETVVKQSAPAAIGGFAGPLVSIAGGVAAAFGGDILRAVICVVLLFVTRLLYVHNNQIQISKL